MAITNNDLRSSRFGQQPGADFTTNKQIFDNVYNDLTRLVAEINTIVGGDITGAGTLNYVPKWDTIAGDNIGDSIIFNHANGIRFGSVLSYPSALFAIDSTTQGMLIPRMTTVQRNLIAAPATSLFIYNTTTSLFNYWDGSAWQTVDSSTTADTLAQVLASGRDVDATGTIKDFSSIDALDINSRYLITAGGIAVVRWNAQELYSSASIKALDWNNRQLIHGDGSTITADWGTRTLSGNWTAVTQAALDNSTKIATTAYVDSAVGAVSAWKLDGNTVGSEKWLGTIDNFALPIRTNNIETARFKADGFLQFPIDGDGLLFNGGSTFYKKAGEDLTISTAVSGGLRAYNSGATAVVLGYDDRTSTNAVAYVGARNYDGNEAFAMNGNATSTFIWKAFAGSGGFRACLTDAGQLGLGTSSTSASLHIKGSGLTTGKAFLVEDSGGYDIFQIQDNGRVGISANGSQTHSIFIGFGTAGASTGDYNTIIGESAFEGTGAGNANTGVGQNVLASTTSGAKNCAIGVNALYANTTGDDNTAMGYTCLTSVAAIRNSAFGSGSLGNHVSGDHNVAMGWYALQTSTVAAESTAIGASSQSGGTTGLRNTTLGYASLATNTTGSDNTALGHQAGFTNIGSRNVFIGQAAGYYRTADSDRLFIHNQSTGSAANDITNSLIYGIFNASVASQALRFNAQIINMAALPVGNGGVSSGELYVDTAANVLVNGDYVVARKV